MAQLRSTVVLKTDITGFTARLVNLSESELSSLLTDHKQVIVDVAAKHGGSVIKGEGDSFWLVFASVTAAALAAMEMQQEVRSHQPGQADERRLAMRAAITLGDVLHQENDIFGEAVNLAARIEAVTPRDETYLSQAAWLALNKAEVRASEAGEFTLKGFTEPVKLYRIEQGYRTRIIQGQTIVFTDLRGFSAYVASHSLADVENFLLTLDRYHNEVCAKYGGLIRMIVGDSYHLTFAEAPAALGAVDELRKLWDAYCRKIKARCTLGIGVHKGDMYVFRSFLYGVDINVTTVLQNLTRKVSASTDCILLSGQVRRDLLGTHWERRLRPVEISPEVRHEADEAYELV